VSQPVPPAHFPGAQAGDSGAYRLHLTQYWIPLTSLGYSFFSFLSIAPLVSLRLALISVYLHPSIKTCVIGGIGKMAFFLSTLLLLLSMVLLFLFLKDLPSNCFTS
jgi:hypothetical protein